MLKASVKKIIGPKINRLRYTLEIIREMNGGAPRECTVCKYVGKFGPFGHPPRYDAQCPKCGSFERHRNLALALERLHLLSGTERILHFAAEDCLGDILRRSSAEYIKGDLRPAPGSLVLNIEKIELPDRSFDVVIANHVLEHVDDAAAMREIHRILTDGGRFIVTVPIAMGWTETYEDSSITDPVQRDLHFGQFDHVRFFGRDFRDRLTAAGFAVQEFVCGGADAVRYGLIRGETIYICTKNAR